MHVDLIEFLRCVQRHDPSWLVASVDRVEERDIVTGRLGCPACDAEYVIRDGVADFRGGSERSASIAEPHAVSHYPQSASRPDDLAVRAAALLDLTTPGGFVLLAGSWAAAAFEFVALLDGVHALVLNPASATASGFGISVMLCDDAVPIRPASARGAALDAMHSSIHWSTEAMAAIRPGGRLIAQADAPVPVDVTVIARDSRHWLAETSRTVASTVQIARGRAPTG